LRRKEKTRLGSAFVLACFGHLGCAASASKTTATIATSAEGGASVDNWAEWSMPNSQADVSAGAPNLESYTDNGDGTVTDNVTRLVWQKDVPSSTYDQAAAVLYCSGLSLATHGDWRLPSVIELVSVVDPGRFGPSIDETYFPSTPANPFWSSSPSPLMPGDGFDIPFDAGNVSTDDLSSLFSVRCVRSAITAGGAEAPPGRYSISSGAVYDAKTGLMWQRGFALANYSQPDAQTYCTSLNLGGLHWRLPTMKELLTLVDFSQSSSPTIDLTAFPGTPEDEFWTSTAYAGGAGRGLGVDFSYGLAYTTSVSIPYNARCVH
jgi:hypothetical protein